MATPLIDSEEVIDTVPERNLEVGKTYKIFDAFPLMPWYDFEGYNGKESMKQIPPMNPFKVLEKKMLKKATYTSPVTGETIQNIVPWYRVEVKLLGEGWVNSIALMGKKLKEVE